MLTTCPNSGTSNPEVELFRLPYEDEDFLTYIDNEELPTSILDLLEKAWPELFYSGCVIAEVRDQRKLPPTMTPAGTLAAAPTPSEDVGNVGITSHVLLRPTTQSLICDVNLLCERSGWTSREDRATLESQLCLATQGPLCLDPDPIVSILARKSCVRRQKFATPAMRRHAKMFSQTGNNRKRKLEETAAPPELKLHDFVQKLNRSQAKPNQQDMLLQHQAMMRVNLRAIVQKEQLPPAVPATSMMAPSDQHQIVTDVSKHARAIQRRADVTDMTPHVVEEYILETAERGANRIYHTKLTIFQRLANEEYLGELYVERDFNERDKKGSTCRFVLGTRPHALRYINQFTEIFTEEGRKPVKITHLVPNQKPRITFTPGMRERMNERAAAVAAANAARASSSITGASSTATGATAAATGGPAASGTGSAAPVAAVINNGSTVTSQKPILSVSVAGPSILKQTLSAPPTNSAQIPIHTVHPPLTAVQVRTATVLQQPQSTGLQLPQTPHPPQQILHHAQQPPKPPTPQQQQSVTPEPTGDKSGEQEMAISAIMQSLMQDSAQFEVDSKPPQPPPQQQQQSNLIGVGSGPQLPTCPVPQASLALCNSGTSITSPVKLPNTPQSPSSSALLAKRVTLKNLLSAQAAQSSNDSSPIKAQTQVKVTMSQLAAQLSRPVTIASNLPSYTQALADQAQVKAVQASPRPRLIVTAQHPPNSLVRSMSDSGGGGATAKVVAEAPNLQALLNSNANSSNSSTSSGIGDNLIPVEVGNNGNATGASSSSSSTGGGSLLERLVSGQPINNSPNNTGSSASSPVTARTNSSADSSNEITLAALLSKPPVQNMSPLAVAASPSSTSQMGSPTKASPLIQQLQQPIPPPRTPLPLPPSPRQQPQASPRITSPRPPSMGQVPSSPQGQATVVRTSSLQQQLMQPPKSQSLVSVPLPVQDINNLHNGNAGNNSNAVNASGNVAHNGGGSGGGSNVVSLQNLLQGGMAVQVSQHSLTQTSNSIPVQLNIPGLSAPVTLSLNVQDQQQPVQQQQPQTPKMVPTSTVVTLATTSTSGGTVLIPQSPNIIQLPQQPSASVISPASIATMRTPTGQTVQLHAANNILKGAQVVQVRGQHGGQPLYVQMPVTSSTAAGSVGQSIQIVRSVDQPVAVRQQQFSSTIQQQPQLTASQGQGGQLVLNSVKASQPSLITLSPQQQPGQQQLQGQPQQVVLQANNTVLQQQSAGATGGGGGGVQNQAGARQVAIQLQEQQPGGGQASMITQAKVVNNQAGVNQRMRQHRKQSLK